jgi:DnaJ-class molecular chaperone
MTEVKQTITAEPVCVACVGDGTNPDGGPCLRCNGTGTDPDPLAPTGIAVAS